MSRPAELSFGDTVVDRAVEVAARAYGDDLMAVFAGVCNRDRRCLSAAASGLARAGVMSIEAAAEAVGLVAKSVRVTRYRRLASFIAAEVAVVADILGDPAPEPVATQALRHQVKRPHCQSPDACAAKPRGYGHCRACEVAARAVNRPVRTPRATTAPRRKAEPRPRPIVTEAAARKARFASRFIDAGWKLGETASLFDLKPHELKRALAVANG